jgi:hypothetical protein
MVLIHANNSLHAICSFFQLLSGFEEDIIELLEEDNKVFTEGIAHVLSRAQTHCARLI